MFSFIRSILLPVLCLVFSQSERKMSILKRREILFLCTDSSCVCVCALLNGLVFSLFFKLVDTLFCIVCLESRIRLFFLLSDETYDQM